MAYKHRTADLKLREQRLQVYQTAQNISSSFPALDHLSLEVRFSGADRLSPYTQIYTGDMQAYFYLQCPSKDCDGGGFDMTKAVTGAVKSRSSLVSGTLPCRGTVAGKRGETCPVTLAFDLTCAWRE